MCTSICIVNTSGVLSKFNMSFRVFVVEPKMLSSEQEFNAGFSQESSCWSFEHNDNINAWNVGKGAAAWNVCVQLFCSSSREVDSGSSALAHYRVRPLLRTPPYRVLAPVRGKAQHRLITCIKYLIP